jgi:phosphate/sulfate permease
MGVTSSPPLSAILRPMSVTSGVAENEGRRTAFTTVNIASWCGCRCKSALGLHNANAARDVRESAVAIRIELEREKSLTSSLRADLDAIASELEGKTSFFEVAPESRWKVRSTIYRFRQNLAQAKLSPAALSAIAPYREAFSRSIEYVPFWVMIGVAVALGAGTMIGYKRIVVTVAEKIGKTHLTYAQGAAAEVIAALTIGLADVAHMPVSTTHVLSSGAAGTMWANRSGIRVDTLKKIGLAWVLTLPAAILLSAALFTLGGFVVPGASATSERSSPTVNGTADPEPAPKPADVERLAADDLIHLTELIQGKMSWEGSQRHPRIPRAWLAAGGGPWR